MTCVIIKNYVVLLVTSQGKAANSVALSELMMPLSFPKRCTESLLVSSRNYSYESISCLQLLLELVKAAAAVDLYLFQGPTLTAGNIFFW